MENNPVTSNEAEAVAVNESLIAPLCRVTPVSKYLAMTLFIVLPFVGVYVGYSYAPKEVVTVQPMVSDSIVEEPAAVTREKETLPDYASQITDTYARSVYGELIYESESTSTLSLIRDIRFADRNAYLAHERPYFTKVVETSNDIILTQHCFKATECLDVWLYKFNKDSRTLELMKEGKRYEQMNSRGLLSTDGTKFFLTGDWGTVGGRSLGYIDLESDTYTNLHTFPEGEGKYFSVCEMGCGSILSIENNVLNAVVFTKGPNFTFTTSTMQFPL